MDLVRTGLNKKWSNPEQVISRKRQKQKWSLNDETAALKRKEEGGFYITFCGGTIVQPSKIITAAHCFDNKKSWCCETPGKLKYITVHRYYAVAGNLRNRARYRADSLGNGQWRKLYSVRYPETYKFPDDDIALVETLEPFKFNKFISAIPYSSIEQDIFGVCKVSGYGQISEKEKAEFLLMGYVNVIPNEECETLHQRKMNRTYCTDNALDAVDKGDSGGPLVCSGTQDLRANESLGILVGVTSAKVEFSFRGRIVFRSNLFTQVAPYTEFLNKSCKVNNNLLITCLHFCTVLLKFLFSKCFSYFYFIGSDFLTNFLRVCNFLLKSVKSIKVIFLKDISTYY